MPESTLVSWRNRVLLAALSGASVWPLTMLLDLTGLSAPWARYALTGAAFGALVLVPLLPATRRRPGPVIALLLGSILIYGAVVELAIAGFGPLALKGDVAIIASGLLGALLTGVLAKLVVPLQATGAFWVAAFVAGLLGGFVFSLVWESSHDWLATVGYVGWQVAVCLALLTGTRSGDRLE
jgi:hypothetical protein